MPKEMTRLVLGRKPGETILIGPDICVRLERVDPGNQVKLSILAPRDVAILRGELVPRPRSQNPLDVSRSSSEPAPAG